MYALYKYQCINGGVQMFCFKCGKKLPDDAKFCMVCGASMDFENDSVGENVKVQSTNTQVDKADENAVKVDEPTAKKVAGGNSEYETIGMASFLNFRSIHKINVDDDNLNIASSVAGTNKTTEFNTEIENIKNLIQNKYYNSPIQIVALSLFFIVFLVGVCNNPALFLQIPGFEVLSGPIGVVVSIVLLLTVIIGWKYHGTELVVITNDNRKIKMYFRKPQHIQEVVDDIRGRSSFIGAYKKDSVTPMQRFSHFLMVAFLLLFIFSINSGRFTKSNDLAYLGGKSEEEVMKFFGVDKNPMGMYPADDNIHVMIMDGTASFISLDVGQKDYKKYSVLGIKIGDTLQKAEETAKTWDFEKDIEQQRQEYGLKDRVLYKNADAGFDLSIEYDENGIITSLGFGYQLDDWASNDSNEVLGSNTDVSLKENSVDNSDEEDGDYYYNASEYENYKALYYVTVNAPDGYVNFREGPGTDYDIIETFSNGETLDVVSDEGRWLEIAYFDDNDRVIYGWVASSQVTNMNEETYSDSEYIYEDAVNCSMGEGDLREARENYHGDLPVGRSLEQMIINEIYARHGYIFKSEDLNEFFGGKSWYTPRTNDMNEINGELARMELETIDFLKSKQ